MKRLLRSAGDVRAAGIPTPPPAQDSVAQFYKGRQITVIVGSSPGGGYDIYARLLARHHGQIHPRQSQHRREQHARRRQQRRGRAYLQRRAEGRHLHRRAAEQRHHGRAVRRRCSATPGGCATTRPSSSISAPPPPTTMSASRARDAPIKTFKQALTQEFLIGASQPGTSHPRLSGDAQQHHRRQDQAGQRLSRHARDHAGDREERGARALRLLLVEPEGAEAGLDQVRLHPRDRAGARQGQSRDQQDGRAAGRGFRHLAGEPQDHGADLFVGNLRPPLSDGAGRARRPGRGAAQGVHGDDERTRNCSPTPSGSGSPSTRSPARTCRSLPPNLRDARAFVEKTKDALVYRAP